MARVQARRCTCRYPRVAQVVYTAAECDIISQSMEELMIVHLRADSVNRKHTRFTVFIDMHKLRKFVHVT